MPFIKQGELIDILKVESTEACVPAVSEEILDNFRKFAANLKKVAPKAEDFLYFSAVMMHAAEAAALNDDGTPRMTATGSNAEVGWDKSNNTWRWMSNDSNIKPYKNSNGDIFPEEELVKAYKKWVGKPLCVDHKSSSVDHVRGFIVDTYYDRALKRVIALCALDKAGYPQLARQVATGVSTCVSMGTAVGKAICSDCARVARTESDFCDHMRRKSCYGEINVDLNPIELSIVVNGADPRANIKHIIAAANTMNSYLDNKQRELSKLADEYNASISFTNGSSMPGEGGTVTQVSVKSADLETFRKDVDKAIADFQKLQSSLSNEENKPESGNDAASNQLTGDVAGPPAADSGLPPPHARYASADVGVEAITELREVTAAIEAKLNSLKQGLVRLANTSTDKQEETMSGTNMNKQGYFLGGGGVNEPTPGQAKYPKDPLNEKLRDHEDKHMTGQNGFPGVGPVDGMHPSPDSAEQKDELQRKKMLARAESEQKTALRRQAIVDLAKQALEEKKKAYEKQGYFLGGGGVNEPTPGKPKYPVDKLEYTLREKEDKHMVGQKPFPGVGPVDGMHPSPESADTKDELARKKLLQRASLRARFVKASNKDGSSNLGASAWEVYRGDDLLLTASVNDLSGGRPAALYDHIATREFGTQLIERIKKDGAEKVNKIIKGAQDSGGAPAGGASAPPADTSAPPADAGKPAEGGENLLEKLEKIRDMASDAVEEERSKSGEQPEMGDDMGAPPAGADAGMSAPPAGGAPMPAAAARTNLTQMISKIGELTGDAVNCIKNLVGEQAELQAQAAESTDTTLTLRKEVSSNLAFALKEAVGELNEHQQELEMLVGLYDKGVVKSDNQNFVSTIQQDALNEATAAVADGFKLMQAYIKYARGTEAIVKRAQIEAQLEAIAEGETMPGQDANKSDDLMGLLNETNTDLAAVSDLLADDANAELEGLAAELDGNDATLMVDQGEPVPQNLPKGMDVVTAAVTYDTKEGRAALRAKLAADATGKYDSSDVQDVSKLQYSDMLDQADGLADGQTQLDVKPSSLQGQPLGLVETNEESLKAMLEVAKAPPKVRKEALAIQALVASGKLDPKLVDELVAHGADKESVSYWKKYFGQVDGGGEFASELVKEHVKADMEAELNKYRVKMARAYELTYDMVDRGLCGSDRATVSDQVEQVMKLNEEGFDTLKRVVAKHAPVLRKEAGRMPQVGMLGTGEMGGSAPVSDDSLFTQLSAAFAKTSKKMF